MVRLFPALVMMLALLAAVGIGVTLPLSHATAPASGGRLLQNDAGSGGDAGDSPALALVIANARRMWSANLTPAGTDLDWYGLNAQEAFCAKVDATVGSPGSLTLAGGSDLHAAATREAMPHRPTRLALAASAGGMPIFGVEPPMMSHTLIEGSGGQPSPSRYTFTFTSSTYEELDPENDGENPEAGSTLANAAPLPASCAAGRLRTASADAEDRYYVDVAESRLITISFAIASGDAAQARIVTPSGAVHATLQSGDSVDVWANQAGRWQVVVAYPGGSAAPATTNGLAPLLALQAETLLESAYILGITDGPDPEPCRPTCR